MNLRRFLPAAALAAGIAVTATAQPPAGGADDKKAPAAATPPAAGTPGAVTPPAPPTNPNVEKAIEAIKKNETLDVVLKHLEAAATNDPNLPPAKVMLAQIYLQLMQQAQGEQATNAYRAARTFLEQASAENAEHPDPYLISGALALNEGRLMDAMLCYEKALASSQRATWPSDARKRFEKAAREGLAQTYLNRRDGAGAMAQLNLLLAADPKQPRLLLQLAQIQFQVNQHDQAFETVKKAYELDNALDLPEITMAKLWDAKPKKDDAETSADKTKAEDFFKKALGLYAKDVKATREYGRWLLNQSRIPDADSQLAAAKGIKADDKETQALAGLSFRYKKNYAEAEKIFDELNRTDRTNPFYAWNLAICMAESAEKTKRDQAVALAQLTQQSNPRAPEGISVLAWCLFKAERLDDAEKAMQAAAQASQGQFPPDTIYYFARILDKKDKSKEARNNLQLALDSKAPFVYRPDAEAFQKDLVAKHGPAEKPTAPKPDDKKDDKKPEEPKKP